MAERDRVRENHSVVNTSGSEHAGTRKQKGSGNLPNERNKGKAARGIAKKPILSRTHSGQWQRIWIKEGMVAKLNEVHLSRDTNPFLERRKRKKKKKMKNKHFDDVDVLACGRAWGRVSVRVCACACVRVCVCEEREREKGEGTNPRRLPSCESGQSRAQWPVLWHLKHSSEVVRLPSPLAHSTAMRVPWRLEPSTFSAS